jgi:periplasmic protein TonB
LLALNLLAKALMDSEIRINFDHAVSSRQNEVIQRQSGIHMGSKESRFRMAYADQQGMSTTRLMSIIVVVLLHALLGYALITGLAFEAVKKVKAKLETIDVQEEKPPEEEPPPPPPEDVLQPPPPVVTPPSPFTPPSNNKSTSQQEIPKNPPSTQYQQCEYGGQVPVGTACRERPKEFKCWNGAIVEQPSQCPPEEKKAPPKPARAKGNPGNWANTNDYPSRALQQEREGTTGFSVTIGPDGRVTSCSITSSSGHGDLDDATCKNVQRRARFEPATDSNGSPTTGSYSNRVRWQIPKD